jgi:hypothetical protein
VVERGCRRPFASFALSGSPLAAATGGSGCRTNLERR